jgi:hypothetical protein
MIEGQVERCRHRIQVTAPTTASTAQTPRAIASQRVFFQVLMAPPMRNPATAIRNTTITEWDTQTILPRAGLRANSALV